MVLIVFSIILAAIAVAISVTRCHSSFGILGGSGIAREKISIEKERTEQSPITSPVKQFLVVVLPDGKVVNPMVADRF
jgi:hypothetical protein